MPDSTTITRTRSDWQIECGPLRWSLTRTHETCAAARPLAAPAEALPPRRPFWPMVAGTFASVSAFGLFAFGARATQSPLQHPHYLVSVAVPAASVRLVPPVRATNPALAAKVSSVGGGRPAIGRIDAAGGEEHFVSAAMIGGDVQEWIGSDGLGRFLTAGPARVTGSGYCRDFALLTHLAGGGSHVRSFQRCASGAVRDAAPVSDAGAASDGMGTIQAEGQPVASR